MKKAFLIKLQKACHKNDRYFNLFTYIYRVFFVLKGRIVPSPPPSP